MSKPDLNPLARSIAMAFAAPLLLGLPAMAQQAAPAPADAASAAPAAATAAQAPVPADAASAPPAANVAPAPAAPASTAATPGADERATVLETVVVTARRTKEKLQEVPTAVTAISMKNIEDLKIDGFQTVGQTVPNVYIQKQGGSPQAPQMQIRGVSNGSLNMQVDSGIGLYVDGVYMGRPGAAAFDLADLERVEVLRGPQGTLFGRNATGGAINLITAGPTGEFGFHGEIGFGNFNDRRQKATVNLPEWNGLAARITLGHTQTDGDVTNTATKRTFVFPEPFGAVTTTDRGGDVRSDAGLIALRYSGVKDLKVDYKVDFTNWKGTMNYRQVGSLDPTPCDPVNAPLNCLLPLMTVVSPFDLSFTRKDHLAVPLDGAASNDVLGHSLVAEYEINKNLTAKYILGYRQYDLKATGNQVYGASEYIDTNGVVGPAGGVFTPLYAMRREKQHQQSHEVQLIGKAGPVDWLAGLFFFEEKGSVNNPVSLFRSYGSNGVVNPISVAGFDYFVGQNVTVKNQSTAAYGHATWHVGQFDVSGGLRYTKDKRSEHVIAGGLIGAVTPGDQDFSYSGSNSDYDASVTYKINPDTNVYGKVATGYVSGGTLFGNRFDPDKMTAYELGFKSNLLNNKLRFNAALFQQKRKDVQIEGFTQIGYFMGKGRGITADGLELELTYVPITGLTLNGSYGYTKVKSSGDLRSFQPKQTAYVGAEYRFARLDNGVSPSLRVDASWHSKATRLYCPAGQNQTPATDICTGTAIPALDEAAMIEASTQVSARLSFADFKLDSKGSTARVSFWGRNLLNEQKKEFPFTLGGSTITSTYRLPRTSGVDLCVFFCGLGPERMGGGNRPPPFALEG